MKHMDDRDNQIKTDLENAKSNATDVDDMHAQANDIIAQAKKEANSIREKARLEATEVAEAKLAEAKSKMDEKYNAFLSELAVEKDTLEKSLIANMPTFKDGLKAKLNSI
jgi:F-type H+-transporting ATPase subunit b